MENNRIIWIINDINIEKKTVDKVSIKEIGQKALGLCHVPEAWTLPFFVIDRNLFLEMNTCLDDQDKIISKYMNNIIISLEKLDLGCDVIIRSSGEKEGMNERGKYESIVVKKDDIKAGILTLINKLKKCNELKKFGMPLIVQKYIRSDICGHISNERRFSYDKRDFIYERLFNGKFDYNKKICLREKYSIDEYLEKSLKFTKSYREMLKIVCTYYFERKERVHIEFVILSDNIFIVQKDDEFQTNDSYDPTNYDIIMNKAKTNEFVPKLLRKVTVDDKGKYRKLENIFIYQEEGIKLPPLYILDDISHIDLKNEDIDYRLEYDLDYLSKRSLVIRTNINSDDRNLTQLSKRSNEIRSFEEAKKFLIETSKDFEKNGVMEYIYIFHNFVPAKVAAFVNAKPLERIVEIQALWGLPEGLYYNAHDNITIDTMRIDISSMEKQKFNITKKESFKENCIIPDENGNWVLKKIKNPFDWKPTIKDDEIIRDIAYKARKITENVGKELSIMWFVDIDEEFYGMNNMPWHHEEFNRNNHYYDFCENCKEVYKKKYFSQEEFIIENNDDVEKLLSLSSEKVGVVKLKPKEDELLRSKDFISKIGNVCKDKKISILLDGSILAHSYYQLINTGATILVSNLIKKYDEKIEFNKLVRDKIPEIIMENGENIKYVKIKDSGLINELKCKLIEEAYELLLAPNKAAMLEEIADLLEVCDAITENIKEEYKFNESKESGGEKLYKLEFTGLILEGQMYKHNINDGLLKYATVKNFNKKFRFDLFFSKDNIKSYSIDEQNVLGKYNEYNLLIMKNVFYISKIQNIKECLAILECIKKTCYEFCIAIGSDIEELVEIKEHKKQEKGGFSNGFVLLETSMNFNEENLFKDIEDISYIPKNIYRIEHECEKDIDTFDDRALLVRIDIPYYYQEEIVLKSKKIDRFLGENSKISIMKSFEETNLIFTVKTFGNEYEQLVFDELN